MTSIGEMGGEYSPGLSIEQAARQLEAEHERRFAGLCDDRDLTTKQDGDETVVYCRNCRFVVVRAVLGGDE